jgi:hypothetical protein
VETIPEAHKEDLNMHVRSRNDVIESLCDDISFSNLEVISATPDNLVFVNAGYGFIAACMTAFAKHLPLSLDATDIWTVISYGFSKHVQEHAEELRSKFVSQQGKKSLTVIVDDFRMASNRPDSGTPAEEWERRIFPEFTNQIETNPELYTILTQDFSTQLMVPCRPP